MFTASYQRLDFTMMVKQFKRLLSSFDVGIFKSRIDSKVENERINIRKKKGSLKV